MTKIHVIRSGETLARLATRYDISLNDLLAMNNQIEDADVIFAGQQINVPSSHGSSEETNNPADFTDMPWFEIARGELDEDEIRGANHNPRIVEYHSTTSLHASDDETPWCSSFVNWCIEEAGLNGTDSAAARSWTKWGKKLTRPRKGCIVVYSSSRGPASGHVGFFDRIENNHIVTLGGNQQNSVNYSSYPKGRLLAYRWPSG